MILLWVVNTMSAFCLEPKIRDLLRFVVPEVQAHWEKVAFIALRYDTKTVDAIRERFQNNVNKCCQEMFEIWLKTRQGVKPKTWSTLIEQLKEVDELTSATENIEKILKNLQLKKL